MSAALLSALLLWGVTVAWAAGDAELQTYKVPDGSHPHDVAPAPDGTVWYTGQYRGTLGRLHPDTGEVFEVELGEGSRPHGVIVGPGGNAWVTDGGLNAIVRVDGKTQTITRYPLPEGTGYTNLNTAVFDGAGVLWFTGQAGIYGRLFPDNEVVEVFNAPLGRGPYGITATPNGAVYFASLAGSYVGRIYPPNPRVTVIQPPTENQGARRVWADSQGRVWVSEWNAGKLAVFDPREPSWREWKLPGDDPKPYAVYVDERDRVWLSDFGGNALHRFDPDREAFTTYPLPQPHANVRQLLGRPGEVWGAESGADRLVVVRYGEE